MDRKHSNQIQIKMKKRGGILPRLFAVLCAVLLVCGVCPEAVGAMTKLKAEGIDENKTGTITMKIPADHADWYIAGSTFRLYKVATLNDDMTFKLTSDFKNCGVDLQPVTPTNNEATASKWMNAASSLISFVREQKIQETQTATMQSNQTVTFSGLGIGLYLIQGDTATQGNRTVTYQPVLICIPQGKSQVWNYEIETEIKFADPTYYHPNGTPTPTGTPTETPSVSPTVTPSVTATPSGSGTPTPTGAVPSYTVTPSPGVPGQSGNHPSGTSTTNPSSSGGIAKTLSVLTGDSSGIMTSVGAMIAAAAVIGLVLINRRRNDGRK